MKLADHTDSRHRVLQVHMFSIYFVYWGKVDEQLQSGSHRCQQSPLWWVGNWESHEYSCLHTSYKSPKPGYRRRKFQQTTYTNMGSNNQTDTSVLVWRAPSICFRLSTVTSWWKISNNQLMVQYTKELHVTRWTLTGNRGQSVDWWC